MKQLGFFIIVSLVFHFLISTSTLYIAEKMALLHQRPEVTQIEIIENKTENPKESLEKKLERTRQLIKQLKTTVDEIKNSKTKARFESEKTQRVTEETKAKNLGPSQNQVPIPKAQNERPPTTEESELPAFAKSKSFAQQQPTTQNPSINTDLPNDIRNSNATNLNTDANIHYSFYNRVEDLFYGRWVERVRFYWSRVDLNYKKTVLAGKAWPTTLEIWLLPTGEFHSVYIKQSSGNKAFDEAAVFAFKDARYFPNPPKIKVEPDGFIRLRYRLTVHVAEY